MKHPDWIELLEASYDVSTDDEAWSERVLESAAPLFERSGAPALLLVRISPTTFAVEHVAAGSSPELRAMARAANVTVPPEVVDIVYRGGESIGSLSEQVFSRHPARRAEFLASTGGQVADVIGVAGHTGTGWVAMFSAPMSKTAAPNAHERQRWPLAATHVAAGLRLRRALLRLPLTPPDVEAVLDPSGRIQHLTAHAEMPSQREALREAVRRIEGARAVAGRRDPEAALGSWLGLVRGRWSLVDHFDSDGKRFIVAVKNDPEHPDPRGLTTREREVAEFVGLGRSTKEIAYALGISNTSVSETIGMTSRKLGLGSRVELATFFSPAGIRARLGEVAVAGERLLVGSCPLLDEAVVERLSEAERAVAALVLAGSTNADIAERRGTSQRTVANQLSALYRKLGIGSRVELAARLGAPTK